MLQCTRTSSARKGCVFVHHTGLISWFVILRGGGFPCSRCGVKLTLLCVPAARSISPRSWGALGRASPRDPVTWEFKNGIFPFRFVFAARVYRVVGVVN